MSLSAAKPTAKAAVKQILEDMITREESSTEEFAERLIEIMEASPNIKHGQCQSARIIEIKMITHNDGIEQHEER